MSRNDSNVEISNEINIISRDMTKKAKEIIESVDELSIYISYCNTLENLDGDEYETLRKCDILRDKLEEITYKLEKAYV